MAFSDTKEKETITGDPSYLTDYLRAYPLISHSRVPPIRWHVSVTPSKIVRYRDLVFLDVYVNKNDLHRFVYDNDAWIGQDLGRQADDLVRDNPLYALLISWGGLIDKCEIEKKEDKPPNRKLKSDMFNLTSLCEVLNETSVRFFSNNNIIASVTYHDNLFNLIHGKEISAFDKTVITDLPVSSYIKEGNKGRELVFYKILSGVFGVVIISFLIGKISG